MLPVPYSVIVEPWFLCLRVEPTASFLPEPLDLRIDFPEVYLGELLGKCHHRL